MEYGSGVVIGYWPAFLFTHLRSHATKTQFGGEVVNKRSWGFHTATEMGSGHFAGEGFRKAAYFRNMKVVNLDNRLIPLSDLKVWANNPNCYNIQPRNDRVLGKLLLLWRARKKCEVPLINLIFSWVNLGFLFFYFFILFFFIYFFFFSDLDH